jgi:UbiD family decarboxylase
MPDQSIRTYIASLLQQGELTRFTHEVDPDENLSAVSWRNFAETGKGCLFEKVKGHPDWQVVSQVVADRRKWGVALGVSEEDVVATLNERISKPVEPVMVQHDDASVKQVIRIGDEVDLRTIPAMWTSEADPSRYIAAGMCIIKDPETGIRNVSFHRAQLIGPDSTGFLICPRQALKIYQMYGALNRPMEVAMVIGANPLMVFSGAFVAPYGQDEFAIAGGLLGEPVRMVKCETIDMEVPADAELVLEGELRPGEMTEEGPFGEVTGGYAQEGQTPLFRIKAITHRKNPIFYAMQCGLPPSDAHSIVCTTIEMKLWEHLKGVAGGIDLLDLRCVAGMSPMMVIIKVRQKFRGQARAAALAALSSPYLHPKIAVIVDEDIDIRDLNQVFWAMTNRVGTADRVQKVNRARVFALDNASPIEEGMSAMYRVGTKMLIDATEDPDQSRATWAAYPGSLQQGRLVDRNALAEAFMISQESFVVDLAARLREAKIQTFPTAAETEIWDAARSGLPTETQVGAILAIAGDNGMPLSGLAKVIQNGDGNLTLSYIPWRLGQELSMEGRPAALVFGAAPAANLGAALDGWLGHQAGALTTAIDKKKSSLISVSGLAAPSESRCIITGKIGAISSVDGTRPFIPEGMILGSDNEILTPDDATAMAARATEVMTAEHLRQVESGLDILDVRCYPETENRLVVVKLRPRVGGQSKTACMSALSSSDISPRLVIAVDDDIDTADLRDVSWSVASRLHAEFDVASLTGLPSDTREGGVTNSALKWFIDTTKPPLTQTVARADFDRAIPKNLSSVDLSEFTPK